MKTTIPPLVKPVGKSDCPYHKILVCSKMLSFFRSCQENTCDVPKPKQDSKELPSNWMINFATGIQIFRGQKFTKFTSVLIGSCKHFERMQLQDGLTGGITLQAGRTDLVAELTFLCTQQQKLVTRFRIKLPKGLPGKLAWPTWDTASRCQGVLWNHRFQGTMWT